MIGTDSDAFAGTFDGDGHILTIIISVSDGQATGLFRQTDGATIKNIRLAGGVMGGDMTGSLVGAASDTTIINASSSAVVLGFGGATAPPFLGTGGLVGAMLGGSVLGSHYDGQLGGFLATGGIVGTMSSGALVSRSSNSGHIFGGAGGGGIVGYLFNSQVRNSYSDGSVEIYEDFRDSLPVSGAFGGIVGLMFTGTISRSYAAGSVGDTDLAFPSGGLAGIIEGDDNFVVYSFAAAHMEGDEEALAAFFGGSLDGMATLVGNAFDTAASGVSVCRIDTPEDFTGCAAVDPGEDAAYWKNTAHAPLSMFNAADVWDFSGAGSYPALRAYLGPEPDESDGLADEDDEESEDADEQPAPRRHKSSQLSSNALASLGVVLVPEAPAFAPAPSAAPAAASPARDLELGAAGEDVRALQKFLNAHGFALATSGAGSPGQETGYFGALTKQALIRYQRAQGIAPAVGYFGPITRAHLKAAGLAGLWW
jgi:hypothetical protein